MASIAAPALGRGLGSSPYNECRNSVPKNPSRNSKCRASTFGPRDVGSNSADACPPKQYLLYSRAKLLIVRNIECRQLLHFSQQRLIHAHRDHKMRQFTIPTKVGQMNGSRIESEFPVERLYCLPLIINEPSIDQQIRSAVSPRKIAYIADPVSIYELVRWL